MAEQQQELSGSQVVGGYAGMLVGNAKGTSLGGAAALAVAPLLGPFAPLAFLLVPAGAVAGSIVGAKIGSKGLSRVALMATGMVDSDLIGGVGNHGGTA
jgi:hypothetical protein